MPIYEFRCCSCEKEFEAFASMTKVKPSGNVDDSIVCDKCNKTGAIRLISRNVNSGGVGEPWEYDYTHKVKPKFVRDSQGQRHKFDPTVHRKGRKGSG